MLSVCCCVWLLALLCVAPSFAAVCIIHGRVNCLNSVPYRCYTGLGHFGRGHLGRGHHRRGHLGQGHHGRGHFGRGHLGHGHFGPLI